MSSAISELAEALSRLPSRKASLVMGRVVSKRPLRVLAEGNVQDEDSLLRSSGVEPDDLDAGDGVAMWAIEDRQRYVILARVVSL